MLILLLLFISFSLASQPAFVAGGSGSNSLAHSDDGINWTGLGTNIFSGVNSIVYAPELSKWVAVGSGTYSCATSSDGINWVGSNPFTTFQNLFPPTSVAWSGSLFLVGGYAGLHTLYSSPDGVTWTPVVQSVITTHVASVVYSSSLGLWVAVGAGTNQIATSPTGTSGWVGKGNTFFGQTGSKGNGVCWSEQLQFFIAVGSPMGKKANSVVTSADGVTFTGRGKPFGTGLESSGYGCAYGNGQYILLGQGPSVILKTTNGITFTPTLPSNIFNPSAGTAAYHGTTWVSTGVKYQSDNIAYSTDNGSTWVGLGNTLFSQGSGCVASSSQ